jgi:hypothetical protein
MTVPHLMNCPHSDDGWCLDCVAALGNENWRLREAMEEYDRTVYYPAKKALYARCEARGHKPGPIHNNGLGWTFVYCSLCGGVCEKHGPDGG